MASRVSYNVQDYDTPEDAYQAIAADNMKKLNNCLDMADQADDIGAHTLAMLAMDREKLLKVDQDLDFINDSLKRCEYHIHSMQSWGGAIGNYFRGKPKPEKSGTYLAKQIKVEKKAPPCPKSILRGQDLTGKGIRKALEEKKLHKFISGEHIMYFCMNGSKDIKKAVNDCVVVSNIGVFQVKNGIRVGGKEGGFPLRGVECAFLEKGNFLAHDRVVVKSWGINVNLAEVSFWNRASSVFMEWLFNSIPQKARAWRGNDQKATNKGRTTSTELEREENETQLQYLERKHNADFDNALDNLGGKLDELNFKAHEIRRELNDHKEIINHVKGRVTDTNNRVKNSNRNARALMR
mmetsp:Transcript_19185/g.28670  ORF Transcript_19185/g.28670 Transcript_19185/m.28670 type:complete len:351 (-) Transcript_19185:141-1193(-)|eukprot:CAMPEP_0167747470 /NCGR_PEP_ID=MMETSP0110_2-20121227/4303_1 /TAXON_ID=629695 /ORGANISM="Gymnochlora sp., Strain CCMP2014" /LENGTH=350 /DNA_ID=CAMNT_0007632383 /DNA_START=40 /DNA_END=1092 /DNA_ORIENTATION=-